MDMNSLDILSYCFIPWCLWIYSRKPDGDRSRETADTLEMCIELGELAWDTRPGHCFVIQFLNLKNWFKKSVYINFNKMPKHSCFCHFQPASPENPRSIAWGSSLPTLKNGNKAVFSLSLSKEKPQYKAVSRKPARENNCLTLWCKHLQSMWEMSSCVKQREGQK